jgi:hypothetical protein
MKTAILLLAAALTVGYHEEKPKPPLITPSGAIITGGENGEPIFIDWSNVIVHQSYVFQWHLEECGCKLESWEVEDETRQALETGSSFDDCLGKEWQ